MSVATDTPQTQLKTPLTNFLPTLGRFVYRMLLLTVVVFVFALSWLYFRQESLLFFPVPLPADYRFELPGVTEEKIAVPGATLSALHFRQPHAKGVIFFLHGNGGNLQSWLTSTDFYQRNGYDLFMIDYRGFGKSSGRIASEAQLHADVLAAWKHVEKEYVGRKNVIYGRSLGTGLATRLATELAASAPASNNVSLLVLVSPYLSLQQIAHEQYPWVPGFVMRYPMRTDLWLPAVRIPTLILHGGHDELINVSHARRLKELKPDAQLLVLPDATHNDIHMFPAYIDALEEYLQ
ncbi:MAG: hypothetical protein JWM03_1825, partial [Rhodocyclales bacterium]|nr:hypothetical protein [Rhodocyclales bacterium]